jgi:hypothetical protein
MSVTPSPIGGFAAQFFDNNGVILSGGKIFTYAAGTTTPQASYTSASGVTPHSNPIILDSAGRVPGGEIWLTDGLVYKFVIETATGILLGTYDNITGVNSNFVNYTIQEEVITATAGQTVFNLSTINYTPGTNSLSVYIDGVNQYAGDSYIETDSDTVTFTSGVHVGGEVKFTTALQVTSGAVDASNVGYNPDFTGAVAQTVQDKLEETVSVFDFMTDAEKAAVQGSTFPTVNVTAAIQAAMQYWLDKFSGGFNFYPGGPGQPYDISFSATDRRTGRIWFPSGTYLVSDQVFSSLVDARSPFCGFEFVGEHRESSVLVLETNGVEAWFYRNPANTARYQKLLFRSLGFQSDDYRYGNFMTQWSDGGPKQMRFEHCDFQNLQKFLVCNGVGNADLNKIVCCTGQFYGDILTLNNDQAVQHDFIGTDFGTYGNFVHVQAGGGGNVNVINGAMDFAWHTDFSPPSGNWMFLMDAGSAVGIGNCTFAFRDLRVEIESYTRTGANPPFGLVNSYGNPQAALPRIIFDNVNFVNSQTYTIDVNGNITSSNYRKTTAVQIFPRQNVEFKNCVLAKNFYYDVNGVNDIGSPNSGGIIKFTDCYDGVSTELPAGESAKQNLHDRVTYTSNAGRVITLGMTDQGTGSPQIRKALDVDPRWNFGFAREESSQKKLLTLKPVGNVFPITTNGSNDYYVDLPQIFFAFRIYIFKPADGSSSNAYQLYLGNGDKSVTYATSTSVSGEFKDAHTIDITNLDLNGVGQLRLWAVGAGADLQSGGMAYIEYI